jgi:hypothetical protein
VNRQRPSLYQLAFVTPGIFPSSANSRKQMRQIPNLRRYARGRPHLLHRKYALTLNFGGLFAFATKHFFATDSPFPQDWRSGMPRSMMSSFASSSVFAVVTIVTSMPMTFSTLS